MNPSSVQEPSAPDEAPVPATAHVFAVTLHALHVGDVAPVVHNEVRVSVMVPVCPVGHGVEVRVCGEVGSGVHDAVTGVQLGYRFVVAGLHDPLVHIVVTW